ncbi:hypothetical protein [Glycomyces salinus]|nr:hypothetical protein [Glycomyces salinus]
MNASALPEMVHFIGGEDVDEREWHTDCWNIRDRRGSGRFS